MATTYDAHVGDSGTTLTTTLRVGGAALGTLTGATFVVKVTHPSGVVESWTAGFTGGAAGLLTFVTPTDAYWDEVGTWRWDVRYTLGAVSQTCDPILLSVGPSGATPGETVPDEVDAFEQTITAGTLDADGTKLYGEGFLCGNMGPGSYVVMTEDKTRLEDACVMLAQELSNYAVNVSMAWAAGNIAYILAVDSTGAAASIATMAFVWEDA